MTTTGRAQSLEHGWHVHCLFSAFTYSSQWDSLNACMLPALPVNGHSAQLVRPSLGERIALDCDNVENIFVCSFICTVNLLSIDNNFYDLRCVRIWNKHTNWTVLQWLLIFTVYFQCVVLSIFVFCVLCILMHHTLLFNGLLPGNKRNVHQHHFINWKGEPGPMNNGQDWVGS